MFRSALWKNGAVALIAGTMLLTGTLASAKRRDNCEDRVRKAEASLHQAERKHGEHSRQAEVKRQNLERVREQCGRRDADHDHDRH